MNIAPLSSQVTIGMGEKPVNGALLQLKTITDAASAGEENASQGLGVPRVALVNKDQLQPMYSETDAENLTEQQKLAHKGLVVYNVKEVEGINPGLNIWDGEQWIAVSETQSKAEVTFDCSKVRLYGRYFRRSPLTADNYLIMPIQVTKKGDYRIIASTSNGYYFQAQGVFDTTGSYEIKLEPMGTPAEATTDKVTFTNNGEPLNSACNFSITVGIATLTYRINNCEDITVFGDYQTRSEMNPYYNYVEIPAEVLIEGTTTWETLIVNGIKFVVNQVIDAPGETVLVAKAQGIPKQSGKFVFQFKTDGAIRNECSFTVEFTSTLGTFADPACKCLDIYEERPDISNGEYFLLDCVAGADAPVKTYCDIVNGGYTLVWSFSERTAYTRTDYGSANNMTMLAGMRISEDRPMNRVTTETGQIDYKNYRLTRSEFRDFPNSTTRPTLKVRICDNPTNMNDEWGLNNYAILSPRSIAENPIETGNIGPRQSVTVGKLWGQKASGGGAYGGWDEVCGNKLAALYNNTSYPTHWDMGGCSTLFEVIPNRGAANNQMRFNATNNMFGWFGETQPNHHFGKCGGASASDFDYTTKTCAGSSLLPHSTINEGEGRYLVLK